MERAMRLIIWGAGELGARVAAGWHEGSVIGVTRSEERHAALRQLGITPHTGTPASLLQPDDRLLLALPGHLTQQAAIAQLATAGVAVPQRTVLISSTAFYEPAAGPIDEQTPSGASQKAQSVAAVEAEFRRWAGAGGVILRCGGLYRPGRGAFSALARKGTPGQRSTSSTLALIHYDDAAAAVLAALRHPAPADLYLCVTPPCPARREFYAAAAVLGLTLNLDSLPAGPAAVYDVTRLRRDLLPVAQYPRWESAIEGGMSG
jgi:nucleoside-diphosphate-sugar epimerase